MAYVAHLLLLLFAASLPLFETVGYFPKLIDLAVRSPISSSSTCGQTRTKYCDSSSFARGICTEKDCHFACCPTCTNFTEKPHNLSAGNLIGIFNGEPRPGKTGNSFGFDSLKDSKIEVRRLPTIEHKKSGFTISVWVNQSSGNTGTIFSKSFVDKASVIYGIVLSDFTITFYYIPEGSNKTESIQVTPLASHYPTNGWHFVTVMVYNTELSYFLDGEYVGTKNGLKNAINDGSGIVTVGQTYPGDKKYDGLMQDIFFYSKALTNREVIEIYTGTFPSAYIAPACRCPPSHPKISTRLPAKCTKNFDKKESNLVSRLNDKSHPIELATDNDIVSYWLSKPTDHVTIDIDLLYQPLQVFYVISLFYGPLPKAVLIERSYDRGQTYHPWQYFAADCVQSFGMPNNGVIKNPDSVNCLQYARLHDPTGDTITFRSDKPGQENVPLRPYEPGCNNLYCSPKLLDFIRATHVRMHFYNHTLSLVNETKAKYFGLSRLIVSGRCECYGHANNVKYIRGNITYNGSCICECKPSTHTQGNQCEQCKSLYNNKPFHRGKTANSYPCVKCECNDHASRCYYNQTLDPSPNDRAKGGGGVCVNCLHNTAGQHCEICDKKFFRDPGKTLDDPNVCTPCGCVGAGVKPGVQDCVKDNSIPGVPPGQCECKDNVTGRLCDQCKPGFYDLKSLHNTGCISCNCDTRGTNNSDITCDVTTGQCNCKANVTGRRCDQCKEMFHNLSSGNPHGCQPCLCNMTGSTSPKCDKVHGQCPCKTTVTGRQCERCEFGSHTLNSSGCQPCQCSAIGTRLGALKRCNPVSGICQCKNYVSGYSCNHCISGYYNLRKDNLNGCTRCKCDSKGTLENTKDCHAISGGCTCKSNVTGVNCDQCPTGLFNLSSSNPNGCQPCQCHPKGTKFGDTKMPEKLDCHLTSGQCFCLSNVNGGKCDQCAVGYVWNHKGQGCIHCNCDPDGSISVNCNATGFCDCKIGRGVGGQFCSECLPEYHSFTKGRCSPCNCNKAGVKKDGCDVVGCFYCKGNVEGKTCDRCKPGSKMLKQENPFGCSGVPSQQGAPYVQKVYSRSLQIAWDPPDQPNGLITRYSLYRNGSQVYNNLSQIFNDTGLQPYTFYTYFLITHTDGGSVRSLVDGKIYRTSEDVPSGVPQPVLTNVYSRSAKASWGYPVTPNGIIRNFVLVSTNNKDRSPEVHCHGLVLKCEITNLRPYTVYNFSVKACTNVGCTSSETNTKLTQSTAPDSQPAPVVIPLADGKKVFVHWDEPAEPNGRIFRYELHQRNYPFQPGNPGRVVFTLLPLVNPGEADLRNTTIAGLVPFSHYEFRVITFTADVSGDTSSNWTRQRTAEAAPEGENAIRPQSYAVSSSKVNISWSLPSTPYGIIIRSNIYLYTNETSYLAPTLVHTVNDSLSGVVSNLQPFSLYKFTVTSCNSVGCTNHSTFSNTRTLPSAPTGQEAPSGRQLNSTHIYLTWNQPSQPNGPVPPAYHVFRSRAAYHYPPINAIDGAHFPGLGYYRLSNTVIPASSETNIEFDFRTSFSDGLFLFLASGDNQEDFLAVELRDGVPWFIFDCQSGVAEITLLKSTKFNDERWHHLKISRNRQRGTIVVDDTYRGQGSSRGTASVISENTGVYVGGVSSLFKPETHVSNYIPSVKKRIHFIGCLRGLRLQNKVVSFHDTDEKLNVDPLSSGCPLSVDHGVYVKGGGYFSVKKGIFNGGKIYNLSFDFKTYYLSGLLMFIYGQNPESYLAVVLDLGYIKVFYQTTCCRGNFTVSPTSSVCDGQWHSIEFTNFAGKRFVFVIDSQTTPADAVKVLQVSSELYFGGVPSSSQASARLAKIGIKTGSSFGGCIKNIVTSSNTIDMSTDLASIRNVDLSGCPKNSNLNFTADTCRNLSSTLFYSGKNEATVDANLTAFTDYLYCVESKQPGSEGGGKSPWFVIRSGDGAPEYQKAPYVTALEDGKSIFVSWFPPVIYNGILRGYVLLAYSVHNSTLPPVKKSINDMDNLNTTLHGLDPYTLYDVRVAAFTNGGRGESPGAMVTTLESVPEDVASPDVERHPYSLFISWRRPFKANGIITNYSLKFDDMVVYQGLNHTFNKTGLRVYSQHTLKLTACTKKGCMDSSEKTVFTAEVPPQNVTAPDVVILDSHSAQVRWIEPWKKNGVIRGYQVLVKKQNISDADIAVFNTSKDQFKLTIRNLTAGTWYSFLINAINGGGATQSPPTTRRTVESSPEDIPVPDIQGLSPYSVLVIMQEPRLPNGVIIRYELFEVDGLRNTLVLNGTLRNHTKTGLAPYTAHSFRSTACTVKGCGCSNVGTGYTLEAAPNGTVFVNISILNATSVSATWTTLHSPNGIVFYNLLVQGEHLVKRSSSFETENTTRVVANVKHSKDNLLFTSLLPYTLFKFQINATNTAGFVLSNIVDGMTHEGAPMGLSAPNVTILNSTAVHVTWLPPVRDNGILLYYELMRVDLESNISKTSNNSLSLNIVITDLEPYTRYEFQVAASTRGGRSRSPNTEITTFEDIPSPIDPPTIHKVDSRSLVVKWNFPTTPNGIITQYIIYRNNSHATKVSRNVTMVTVGNLEPFTIYTFSIGVCTQIGCSNSSLSRLVRTLEDVPEGQSSPTLLHAPGPSILIRWSAPAVTNGKISEYKIQRSSQRDLSNISFVATVAANLSSEHRDRTVQPCSKYYYRVIAFTKKGGTPSPWNNITTQEGAPDVVPKPITRTLNSSAIHVTWSQASSQCNITEYMIRVIENHRNYTGFSASAPRSFTVGNLLPYKVYNIVVTACTLTACRDSTPSSATTETSFPRDQPPPIATPLDSRSLRVTWLPPNVPGGRILKYVLYRRTLQEPVAENFTTSSNYTAIYIGLVESFDDNGMMSIFSLQQYKVMVINIEGNTTSSDSRPYRTGPAPPLAGVILSGLPINHTSIFLNWTIPELKLLRGLVQSYEVHYKDLDKNIEYTYMNDLNGSVKSVVVTPLKPSKDYSLKVILNNDAGTFPSNDVKVRTLDGAPEGFDKPNVRTINSTTIEVTWKPPRIPNGRITTYILYANDVQMGNTSALAFNVTSLIPFTVYAIQVEVCTVYTCVRSIPNMAKTLPAVPEQLDPPRLSPGPRNMMVMWVPPRRPNGVMRGYKLFRRHLELCPTSPPPVVYCTYLECPLAEELCGTICYNPKNKICCNGVVHNKDSKKTCCDENYLTKTSPDDVCCSGRFFSKSPNNVCCHGYKLVKPGQVCCKSSGGSVQVGDGNACCDGTPYDNATKKYCACGALYNEDLRHCCGGKPVSRAQICCGGTETNGRAYDQDLSKKCCGSDYVPMSSLCCTSKLGTWKVYNYPSITDRNTSGDQCCETNKVTAGLSCCNGRGYNASSHVCADKTGCGTGNVCIKSSKASACNRCDFDRTLLICGFVPGYYSTITPTPPSKDCGSEFKEIASGNGQYLSYDDQDVEPYTTYEYYLFAQNTEGNVSSSKAMNTTLMDAPEGLVSPIIKVLSARSIEIQVLPPKKLNGIISEYKVTRIDKSTSVKTVFSLGLNLSYVDSGLQPYTPYLYILEACTRICSNVTSENVVYTSEATPVNVSAPMLKALGSSSIEIKWQPPGKRNGVIRKYIIKRINSTNDTVVEWLRNSSQMMLVDTNADLRPYTNYTYTVTACTKIGCSTSPRGFVITLEAAPEGVDPPVLRPRNARSVEVSWGEPGKPNGIITRYTLYRGDQLIYNGTEGCQKSKESKVECRYQDRGLTPHTWYNYSVEASTNGGKTRSDASRVQTPESSPEGIPVPTVTPLSSSSVLVSWTQPSVPNGNIDNYIVIVDSKDEKSAGLAMQLTVTGLKPYTNYTFQIKACTIRGCGIGNRTDARTLEAPPGRQPAPRLVALSDAVVRVTWSPSQVPNGVIISYEVERKLLSSVPIVVFKTTQSNGLRWETLNSGLLPYRNYSYRIRAINRAGSTRSPWSIVRTLEGVPSSIFPPTVHVLNATAVKASWKPPGESNGHITGYELWSRELDNSGNKIRVASSRNPEQNVTVSGLKPNTNYEFQLAVRTIGGIGYSQWALAETLEAPPLGLRSLSARKHVNGRELTLTWGEPSQPNGVITDYIIYSDGVRVFSGTSKECHLSRLQPFTSYTFQLEACTSAGCTKGLPQVITTAEIPPKLQQAPIFVTINSTFVTIQWRPPALSYGIIILYQVLRSDNQSAVYETNETNKTVFTYTDNSLRPFTKYEYKVRANNTAGSTESPTATVTTVQASPALVNAPVPTPAGSSSVNVAWSPPERPNGVVISYTLRRNNTVVGHWSSKFSFQDTMLDPSTLYSYWLTVCTGGGCTDSVKATVKTGESRPGVVSSPTLTVLSSLAIKAVWQPPLITNGRVISYVLYMNGEQKYSGNKLSEVISNLAPFTTYTFYVSACTTRGCTAGESSTAMTSEDTPGDLDKPTYSVLGRKALEIKWRPPRVPNGVIKYYLLKRNSTLIFNGSDLRFNDLQVLPYSIYKYVVTAVNSAGRKDSPELYTNRTSPGTPENISVPVLTPLSGTEIRVSWLAPAKPNGKIAEYFVLYNNIHSLQQRVNVGVNMSYVAKNLEYFTEYRFRLSACTSGPLCADSVESTARTLEGRPRGLHAPEIPTNKIEARYVVVFWSPPTSPNGLTLSYLLHRRVVKEIRGDVTVIYKGLGMNFTDATLVPFQKYEYRVVCVNSKAETQSKWTLVITKSAPPENVPTPRVLKVTASSIDISIYPPGKPNGEIKNYTVEVNGKNVSNGKSTKRKISGLEPYVDYSVRVFACTREGCTPSEAVTQRTDTGAPGQVEKPTFGKVTHTSIHVHWKHPVKPNGEVIRFFVVFRFVCSEYCIRKRAASENVVDVGLNTSYIITNLEPYTLYEIVIRVENKKQSTDSEPVTKRTRASDPKYVRRPVANVTDNAVVIDWSKSFRLNGPLSEYILYENELMIFRGIVTQSGELQNRREAEFIYVVSATTTVNDEKKTVISTPFSINNSGVTSQISGQEDSWYRTIWFLVLISVFIILAVFAVVAVCLRRTSGDRTVYLRSRDPLAVRPKSRSAPLSLSSNYTPSEAQFNLGMTELNYDTHSRASTFVGESDKLNKFDDSSEWEGYAPYNESYGNTGWLDDDKTWKTDEDEPDAVRSTKYQVFTDTHL